MGDFSKIRQDNEVETHNKVAGIVLVKPRQKKGSVCVEKGHLNGYDEMKEAVLELEEVICEES